MPAAIGRVAPLALSLTLLVGCTSDSTPQGPAQSQTSPTSPSEPVSEESTAPSPVEETSTSSAAKPAMPELGDCWEVPPDKALRTGYWYDDSPKVSCSEPHTTETVSVYPLEKPTREKAELLATGCHGDVAYHLGVDTQRWVLWTTLMYLPSREQVEAGASWVRCDVSFPADYPASRPRRHTLSAVDAATKEEDALWACLDEDPRRAASQPLVACSEPHRHESTGTLAALGDLTAYPARRALSRAAAQQCREDLPASQRGEDVGVMARWDPRAWFDPDRGEVYGDCWFERADGAMLPPRR